jgi:hypothetical protein
VVCELIETMSLPGIAAGRRERDFGPSCIMHHQAVNFPQVDETTSGERGALVDDGFESEPFVEDYGDDANCIQYPCVYS